MPNIWRLLKKPISIQTTLSWVLAFFVIYWMFNRYGLQFFIALYALVFASAVMFVYLAVTWRRQSKTERWDILLSILGWLFIAYTLIQANDLEVWLFFGLYD